MNATAASAPVAPWRWWAGGGLVAVAIGSALMWRASWPKTREEPVALTYAYPCYCVQYLPMNTAEIVGAFMRATAQGDATSSRPS